MSCIFIGTARSHLQLRLVHRERGVDRILSPSNKLLGKAPATARKNRIQAVSEPYQPLRKDDTLKLQRKRSDEGFSMISSFENRQMAFLDLI